VYSYHRDGDMTEDACDNIPFIVRRSQAERDISSVTCEDWRPSDVKANVQILHWLLKSIYRT